ncbi:isoleucine--tRNA ligase [soil metagenome]
MTDSPAAPDYSSTVNLPKTDFPQKAGLSEREPLWLEKWEKLRVSENISARISAPDYVLHDGPPYANGDIHIGHTLNKVLKDIIVRYKSMRGFRTHYVPGWDCHGLPIEQKVVEKLRADKTYAQKTPLEIRKLCAEYARGWVDKQREQFKRLGIGGDWDHPYITMDPGFEVAVLDALQTLVEKGFVYKGLKVVHWDPVFETALAEAEIEYNDDHVSPSIYVKFPFVSKPPIAALEGASIVIWTTTPWTLPANLGVSVHPDFDYVAYRVNGETYVVAEGLLKKFEEDTGLAGGEVLERFKGAVLDRQVAAHPLIAGKPSLVMLAHHVTLEAGTGAVHTAPGHGVEDFIVGAQYGLPAFNPVDERGLFTSEYPDMQGQSVFKANDLVIAKLTEAKLLLGHKPYKHSYPYSWRSRKPVIMRATEQWFMAVEKDGLRDLALAECERVTWTPAWGRDRIYNMLATRPDWCLSRQRSWGVPIPSILDKETRKSMLLPAVIENVKKFTESEGTDCWFARPVKDFLPLEMQASADRYEKEFNCLDVWFDSGSTHLAVLNEKHGLSWPADLYLEGGDQHRGWFQSSMWVALGVKGAAPYRQVLTHGFVLDANGQPMSKSLGNVINPLDVIKQSGADILRLWVSSEDYRGDVSISKGSIEQIANAYRKIRNTLRHLFGNLSDFDPGLHVVPYDQLYPEDQYCLAGLAELIRSVTASYDAFEFHTIFQRVNAFCVGDLSGLYLDNTKDRMYCYAPNDRERRAAQTVYYDIAKVLTGLMAPILAFTAEEAWGFIPGVAESSVHLSEFPTARPEWEGSKSLLADYGRLAILRESINKKLETLRSKENKLIGKSLDARVLLRSDDQETLQLFRTRAGELAPFFLVSQVDVEEGAPEAAEQIAQRGLMVRTGIAVSRASGKNCPRCWRWMLDVGTDPKHPDLCGRCADVVRRIQ